MTRAGSPAVSTRNDPQLQLAVLIDGYPPIGGSVNTSPAQAFPPPGRRGSANRAKPRPQAADFVAGQGGDPGRPARIDQQQPDALPPVGDPIALLWIVAAAEI